MIVRSNRIFFFKLQSYNKNCTYANIRVFF